MPLDAKALGAKKGKLPLWMWIAAGLIGVLLVYFLSKRKGTSSPSVTADSGSGGISASELSAILQAQAGGLSQNSAPASQLSDSLLAALGISLDSVSRSNEALANVAVAGEYNLASLASGAVFSSLDLAGRGLEASTALAASVSQNAFDFANVTAGLAFSRPTYTAPGGDSGNGGTQTAAPTWQSHPLQVVAPPSAPVPHPQPIYAGNLTAIQNPAAYVNPTYAGIQVVPGRGRAIL